MCERGMNSVDMIYADHRKVMDKFVEDNNSLTEQIAGLAKQSAFNPAPQDQDATRALVLKLYDSIVTISDHKGYMDTPDQSIFTLYYSFLCPIRALSELEGSHFLSARMMLYLAESFSYQSALHKTMPKHNTVEKIPPLHRFIIALDDALLEPLRKIWDESNNCNEFNWVFEEYPVQRPLDESSEEKTAQNRLRAQALTPRELEDLGDGGGRRWFVSRLSHEEPTWKSFPNYLPRADEAPQIRHIGQAEGERVQGKSEGCGGPVREMFLYRIVDYNEGCEETLEQVSLLRRSNQFVLDAQRISQPIIMRKKRILAQRATELAGMPPEIQRLILGYLPKPPKHFFILSLNLSERYQPFPLHDMNCSECEAEESGEEDLLFKLTCLHRSVYIWNLALRAFHVFHKMLDMEWGLCRYGLECTGHHTDMEWKISDVEDLAQLLQDLISNEPFPLLTVETAGFDSIEGQFLGRGGERQERLFKNKGPYEDCCTDFGIRGGLGGLMHTMLHQRLQTGGWRGEGGRGQTNTEPEWAHGYNRWEMKKALRALALLHTRCRWV